jgi:hypothetical protein
MRSFMTRLYRTVIRPIPLAAGEAAAHAALTPPVAPSRALWQTGSLLSVLFVGLLWVGLVPRSRAEAAPKGPTEISESVEGEWSSSLDDARVSALKAAQHRLQLVLPELKPATNRVPSLEMIREEMVAGEYSKAESFPAPINETMYKITLDLKVGPKQLKELRREERVAWAAWLMGGISIVLGLVSVGFRLDEWTRGYLTRWLIIGTVAIIVLVGVAWCFMGG